MNVQTTAESFKSSATIRRLWPEALRERTQAWFPVQGIWNRDFDEPTRPQALAELWAVLAGSPLRTLPLLLTDSEPRLRVIAETRQASGDADPKLAFHLGVAALADRKFEVAGEQFARAGLEAGSFYPPPLLRALALGLAGRVSEAEEAASALPDDGLGPAAAWKAWLLARLRAEPRSTRSVGGGD